MSGVARRVGGLGFLGRLSVDRSFELDCFLGAVLIRVLLHYEFSALKVLKIDTAFAVEQSPTLMLIE